MLSRYDFGVYFKSVDFKMKVSDLSAPSFIAWQITRDCNLACLHCCTDSAPGRPLPHELTREETLSVAAQIVKAQVPYVMLAGGGADSDSSFSRYR